MLRSMSNFGIKGERPACSAIAASQYEAHPARHPLNKCKPRRVTQTHLDDLQQGLQEPLVLDSTHQYQVKLQYQYILDGGALWRRPARLLG